MVNSEDSGPSLRRKQLTHRGVALGGAGLSAVAAVLPWARAESPDLVATVRGIDTDGFLTILLAISVAGLVLVQDWERLDRVGSLLTGGLVVALAVRFRMNPVFGGAAAEQLSTGDVTVTPQSSVYLTLVSGGLIVAGSLWALAEDS